MLIKITNYRPVGEPVSEEAFRRLHGNISFPRTLTPEAVQPFGYGIFIDKEKPELGIFEKAVNAEPIETSAGIWQRQWQVQEMSEEEKNEASLRQSAKIRDKRRSLLLASDWTQVPDAVNAGISIGAWASYRQQLRDVTAQSGFPWDVNWPEPPEPIAGVICDYRAFYDALLISPAYATIRSKAVESSSVLTACVEFIAAIGDAKNGRPNVAAIQACVDLLCAAAQFTAEEMQTLTDVMQVGKLDQVYTLPAQ